MCVHVRVSRIAEENDVGRHSPVPGRRKRHATGDRDERENTDVAHLAGIMKNMGEIASIGNATSSSTIVSTDDDDTLPAGRLLATRSSRGDSQAEESLMNPDQPRRGSMNAALGDDLFTTDLDDLDLFTSGPDDVQATICSCPFAFS